MDRGSSRPSAWVPMTVAGALAAQLLAVVLAASPAAAKIAGGDATPQGGLTVSVHASAPADLNADGLTDAGDLVAYTYVVSNGPHPLNDVTVTDILGSVSCPQPSLPAGASETCPADAPYMVSSADVIAGAVVNTATARGVPVGGKRAVVSVPATVSTKTTEADPRISLVSSANAASLSAPGGKMTTDFVVANGGNVTISAIVVIAEPGGGSAEPNGDTAQLQISCPAASLDPGQREVCTSSRVIDAGAVGRGEISETASAVAANPVGNPVASNTSTIAVAVAAVVAAAQPSQLALPLQSAQGPPPAPTTQEVQPAAIVAAGRPVVAAVRTRPRSARLASAGTIGLPYLVGGVVVLLVAGGLLLLLAGHRGSRR